MPQHLVARSGVLPTKPDEMDLACGVTAEHVLCHLNKQVRPFSPVRRPASAHNHGVIRNPEGMTALPSEIRFGPLRVDYVRHKSIYQPDLRFSHTPIIDQVPLRGV